MNGLTEASSDQLPEVSEALALMARALGLLDDSGVPGDIGAHLDLAICRLREHLGFHRPPR